MFGRQHLEMRLNWLIIFKVKYLVSPLKIEAPSSQLVIVPMGLFGMIANRVILSAQPIMEKACQNGCLNSMANTE